MTITDAIIKVLNLYPDGLTVKQIYDEIIANKLYEFGAEDPVNVVTIQIKRYCENVKISNPSPIKYFSVVKKKGDVDIYKIKSRGIQEMGVFKKFKYIKSSINGVDIFTFTMSVSDLAAISYVAVRGQDKEEGAVQRVLNRQRISSIKRYVLDDNMFVNTFVLNWTNTDPKAKPKIDENNIEFPIIMGSAQLIDGQHRLEGLRAAMTEKEDIAYKSVIVSMAINLATIDAAKIFLNINSEQKPVPKSLIYDLYGVTEEDRNYAINRANDLANMLNTDINSPYYRVIKFPGTPRGKGKLDLSTVVSSLKTYVDRDGKFEEKNIRELDYQYTCLLNYFNALKFHADKSLKWSTINLNIFFKAAGFIGAVEFFFEHVLPKCVSLRSFKQEVIVNMFDFSEVELITPNDIVTTDGRTARKRVIENLKEAFISDTPGESDYDF